MFRGLILVTVFLVAAWADSEKEKKCFEALHHGLHHCCKKSPPLRPPPPEDSGMQECMQLQAKGSCDREICIASKRGIASSDGKIDKAALQERLEKDFTDNAELAKLIVDKCVNGDISKYGRSDMCDLMKLKICTDIQFAVNCPEWDDNGPCEGIKDQVEECAELYA